MVDRAGAGAWFAQAKENVVFVLLERKERTTMNLAVHGAGKLQQHPTGLGCKANETQMGVRQPPAYGQ